MVRPESPGNILECYQDQGREEEARMNQQPKGHMESAWESDLGKQGVAEGKQWADYLSI